MGALGARDDGKGGGPSPPFFYWANHPASPPLSFAAQSPPRPPFSSLCRPVPSPSPFLLPCFCVAFAAQSPPRPSPSPLPSLRLYSILQ